MQNSKGLCYWITGLSGAGKTSLANNLVNKIKTIKPNVAFLDGDDLREVLDTQAFNHDQRVKIGYIYSRLAKMLVEQNITVVISVMALFKEVQLWNRNNIPNYFEVFLDVPIEELVRRDPKGLYKKFNSGLIKNMMGLDLEPDYPKDPYFHFKWQKEQLIEENSELLFEHFKKFFL